MKQIAFCYYWATKQTIYLELHRNYSILFFFSIVYGDVQYQMLFLKSAKIPQLYLLLSISCLVLSVKWIRAWLFKYFCWKPNWRGYMSSFLKKTIKSVIQKFLQNFCQCWRVKKLVYSLNNLTLNLFCMLVWFCWFEKLKEITQRKKIG